MVGLAKPREGRHDSGIEGELGPVPDGETVRDNFDAPGVCDGHIGRCGQPWRQPPGRLARRHALAAGPG